MKIIEHLAGGNGPLKTAILGGTLIREKKRKFDQKSTFSESQTLHQMIGFDEYSDV
jgi:hypothetical protein